ncbi:hypothetical protein RI129_000101 [Pyrocoelia pectoralis]|uniref:Uncharacterized protein n=1 Tax=Pyrocoelia pectoralis TaxID=417401 RepID=A0AAN7V1Q3_9COLE
MYKTLVTESNIDMGSECAVIDIPKNRYPFCIVWTPIPFLTWLFPVSVIRDFAGPYYVSEYNMLKHSNATGGVSGWDRSNYEASDIYKERMHNLFCDNMSLSFNWNMIKLAFLMLFFGKYVSFVGFLKTWLPFLIILHKYSSFNINNVSMCTM